MRITWSFDKLASSKKNGSKPVFSRNNSNKLAFKRNNGNSKVGFDGDNIKYAKKSKKLKNQKLTKSQNLSKSRKLKSEKLSKSENSPNFNATKVEPSFLTLNAKTAFNLL